MGSTLENIIKSPKLEIYSKEIINILNDEHKKRKEFYMKMKEGDKVEFINGEMIFQSPVKHQHAIASDLLFSLILNYVNTKKLGNVGHEKRLISLTRNDYEPDICFWNSEKSNNFEASQIQFPPPDFIVEVLSPSTEHIDRVIKFEDYAAHGVRE